MGNHRWYALVVLLALLCGCSTSDGRSLRYAGALSGAGFSGQAARHLSESGSCPPGCAADGCVLDSTEGGYRCIKCLSTLLVNNDDGTCHCPAGRHGTTDSCQDCGKGWVCQGGFYTGPGSPARTSCGPQMTTLGQRSTSIWDCVNMPGTYYSLEGSTPTAVTCPADSYCSGLHKQRVPTPCAPGFVTAGLTGQQLAQSCTVPEGYFLQGPGRVAPCPRGEYKSGFGLVGTCPGKCAAGASTPTLAATSEAACTVVLPTFYPSIYEDGIVRETQPCPQSHWCPGGTPTAAFNPQAPSTAGTTVEKCANGTMTQGLSARSPDSCLTPPGHRTTDGATVICADGEFRGGWQLPEQAESCQSCGDGILSDPDAEITVYAITPDATPSQLAVRTTAAACYIKPGMGLYYSSLSGEYRGVNCDQNGYGVANTTYGRAPRPCRRCHPGMTASDALPTSAAYLSLDDSVPPLGGFTSALACVTKPGHGYNGWYGPPCPPGSYNSGGNYEECTECPTGLSTPSDPASQVSIDNCTLAPGFGFYDTVQPCPIGTFNAELHNSTTAPCNPCDEGFTTLQVGATSAGDCVPS